MKYVFVVVIILINLNYLKKIGQIEIFKIYCEFV